MTETATLTIAEVPHKVIEINEIFTCDERQYCKMNALQAYNIATNEIKEFGNNKIVERDMIS